MLYWDWCSRALDGCVHSTAHSGGWELLLPAMARRPMRALLNYDELACHQLGTDQVLMAAVCEIAGNLAMDAPRDSSVGVLIKCRIDQNERTTHCPGRKRDTPEYDHHFRRVRAQQLFHVRM